MLTLCGDRNTPQTASPYLGQRWENTLALPDHILRFPFSIPLFLQPEPCLLLASRTFLSRLARDYLKDSTGKILPGREPGGEAAEHFNNCSKTSEFLYCLIKRDVGPAVVAPDEHRNRKDIELIRHVKRFPVAAGLQASCSELWQTDLLPTGRCKR